MKPLKVICDWCGQLICVTGNELFYEHRYTSPLTRGERKRCPNSGKDSERYSRK